MSQLTYFPTPLLPASGMFPGRHFSCHYPTLAISSRHYETFVSINDNFL